MDLIQKLLSWISFFIGNFVDAGIGRIADIGSTFITVMRAYFDCASPWDSFISFLSIAFLLVGLLLGYVFSLFTGLVIFIAGIIVTFIFGFIMTALVSAIKLEQCRR